MQAPQAVFIVGTIMRRAARRRQAEQIGPLVEASPCAGSKRQGEAQASTGTWLPSRSRFRTVKKPHARLPAQLTVTRNR